MSLNLGFGEVGLTFNQVLIWPPNQKRHRNSETPRSPGSFLQIPSVDFVSLQTDEALLP